MSTLNAFFNDVESFLDKLAGRSADALHDAADALGGLSDWVRALAGGNVAGQPAAAAVHHADPARVADLRKRLDDAKAHAAGQPVGAGAPAALPFDGAVVRKVIGILSAVLDVLSSGQ